MVTEIPRNGVIWCIEMGDIYRLDCILLLRSKVTQDHLRSSWATNFKQNKGTCNFFLTFLQLQKL